jgi:hypothetical protein
MFKYNETRIEAALEEEEEELVIPGTMGPIKGCIYTTHL